MLESVKFLEKTKYFFFLIFFLFPDYSISETIKSKILIYNNDLKNSSALFLQNDGLNIQEGKIFFGKDRVKINYLKPRNLTIILSETKGAYINHQLKETQYFNTKKSHVSFLLKILNGINFSEKIKEYENFIEISDSFNLNQNIYKIKIIYENNPLKLRKILILENNQKTEMSFFNHIKQEKYEGKFFSMVNPYLN